MNIVIAHFNSCYVRMPGGVEKVTCNLANAMTARGHSVTILYRESKEGHAYFPLDERVPEHNILYEDGQYMIQDKLPRSTRIKREFFRLFNAKKRMKLMLLPRDDPMDLLYENGWKNCSRMLLCPLRCRQLNMW